MPSGLPYFKCYPSNFLSGVLGMEADIIGVYSVIIMMIYDRGGPILDDRPALSWRCRVHMKRFNNIIDHLVQSGKLTLIDGSISNTRAETEIGNLRETSEKQARNANARWDKSGKKDNEINKPEMPPHSGGNPILELEARKERNLTVPCPKPVRTKTNYPLDFLEFWQGYPTDSNMSKKEAYDIWKKMDPEQRELAIKALPAFRAYCKSKPDYRPVHACRFLAKERYEGHAEVAETMTETILVKVGTPEWRAWEAYSKQTTGKSPPVSQRDGGWRFLTQWPPQAEVAA